MGFEKKLRVLNVALEKYARSIILHTRWGHRNWGRKKLRKHKKLYILHSKIKFLITYEIYIHVAARNVKMTLLVPPNLPHQVVVFIYYAFFLYYVTHSLYFPHRRKYIRNIYKTKPQIRMQKQRQLSCLMTLTYIRQTFWRKKRIFRFRGEV